MPYQQAVIIPDSGPLKGPEDVLTLREPHDYNLVYADLLLTNAVFLRNIDHAMIGRQDCSTIGVVEVRVAVGVARSHAGVTQAGTPMVAIWHHQCGCGKVWTGIRGVDTPQSLMRQVLNFVPRYLTARERLDLLFSQPLELLIVGDYDAPRQRLERLFREFVLPAEIEVSVVETGSDAVAWMASGRRLAARPVLLVRDVIRFEPTEIEATLENSLQLVRQLGADATFVAWYPGKPRTQADVPLLEAGCARFWDRRYPRESLVMMVLDAAGVLAMTTDI